MRNCAHPAKYCRKHSVPHSYKVKRAKTAKKDIQKDPFEVSLGTESDDSDGPEWYKRPHRSYPRDRNATRTESTADKRGRSPPRLRLRSRKNTADEEDL